MTIYLVVFWTHDVLIFLGSATYARQVGHLRSALRRHPQCLHDLNTSKYAPGRIVTPQVQAEEKNEPKMSVKKKPDGVTCFLWKKSQVPGLKVRTRVLVL